MITPKHNCYLLESATHNRGFVTLIFIGVFNLILPPTNLNIPDWYKELYEVVNAVLIGVGIGGLLCWVFAFRLFDTRKFTLYYALWLICHFIEIFYFISIIFWSIKIIGSVSGFVMGVVTTLVLFDGLVSLKLEGKKNYDY